MRPQRVIDVVADHSTRRLRVDAAAVKVVAPRFEDDVQLHAVGSRIGVTAGRLNGSFLDGGIIEVVAALRAGFRRRGQHALEGRP